LRVEIVTNELIEKKFEEEISTLIQQKKRALKIKKIVFEEKQRVSNLQFNEVKKTENHIEDHYEVQNSNFKENKALLEPSFLITIYRLNERNGAGKKDKYYWIKGQETIDVATKTIREFSMKVEGVKKNIEDYYNNLFNNLD